MHAMNAPAKIWEAFPMMRIGTNFADWAALSSEMEAAV
jgi:hypothetical protein